MEQGTEYVLEKRKREIEREWWCLLDENIPACYPAIMVAPNSRRSHVSVLLTNKNVYRKFFINIYYILQKTCLIKLIIRAKSFSVNTFWG